MKIYVEREREKTAEDDDELCSVTPRLISLVSIYSSCIF